MSDSPGDDISKNLRLAASAAEREQLLADYFNRRRLQLHRMIDLRLDRRLRGRVSPSDVFQEAYLEAAARLPKYIESQEVPFHLWVRRVTADKLYDLHRRHLGVRGRDARRDASIDHPSTGPRVTSAVLAERLIGEQPAPSELVLEAERREALVSALERLDTLDREIITLRSFELLTAAQAAEVLDVEPAMVRQRYVRALKRLKSILAWRWGDEAAT